jgi:hypothetical protein
VIPHLSLQFWIAAAVAALCTGISKGGFSGFGLITVLLMAMILPAKESTGAVLPLLIAADLMAVTGFRRHADWKELRGLLPATIPGLLAGWLLIRIIPDAGFGRFLGWMILAMMTLLVWQRIDPRVLRVVMHHRGLAAFSGLIAGVSTMTANAGGPAMTFHLLARRFDKMAFVGTSAWFFFIINLIKVPLSLSLGLISWKSLLLDLFLLPAVAIGFLLGKAFLGRIPQSHYEKVVILMSAIAALKLVIS